MISVIDIEISLDKLLNCIDNERFSNM